MLRIKITKKKSKEECNKTEYTLEMTNEKEGKVPLVYNSKINMKEALR